MPKLISLDGSTLEGGGQLVRVALALCSITSLSITIQNIRANRASHTRRKSSSNKVDGGLKESHLAALQFLAHYTNASIEGASTGSREVTFEPSTLTKVPQFKNSLVDFVTRTTTLSSPGAISLIIQAIYPYLCFGKLPVSIFDEYARVNIKINGGTHVPKAPSIDYLQHVFLPIMHDLGFPHTEIKVHETGWLGSDSRSNAKLGSIELTLFRSPSDPPLTLSSLTIPPRGPLTHITAIVRASPSLHDHITTTLTTLLRSLDVSITFTYHDSKPSQLYILLIAHTATIRLGRDHLASPRAPKTNTESIKIADIACQSVVHDIIGEIRSEASLDEYMSDQIIIFQALVNTRTTLDNKLCNDLTGLNIEHADQGDAEEYLDDRHGCANVDSGDIDETQHRSHSDNLGTLHARTVWWVCDKILSKYKG